jgi:hypothetical protein
MTVGVENYLKSVVYSVDLSQSVVSLADRDKCTDQLIPKSSQMMETGKISELWFLSQF